MTESPTESPSGRKPRFSMFRLMVLMSVLGSSPAWSRMIASQVGFVILFIIVVGLLAFIGLRDFGADVNADPPNFS